MRILRPRRNMVALGAGLATSGLASALARDVNAAARDDPGGVLADIKWLKQKIENLPNLLLIQHGVAPSGDDKDWDVQGEEIAISDSEPAGLQRAKSYTVRFDTPYMSLPTVHVGLTHIDLKTNDNRDVKVDVAVTDRQLDRFQITFRSWEYGRVYYLQVGWLAFGWQIPER